MRHTMRQTIGPIGSQKEIERKRIRRYRSKREQKTHDHRPAERSREASICR